MRILAKSTFVIKTDYGGLPRSWLAWREDNSIMSHNVLS
jgi:hypothetical protein